MTQPALPSLRGRMRFQKAEPDLAGPRNPLLPASLLLFSGQSHHVECASHFLERSGEADVHRCRPDQWDISWSPALHAITLLTEHSVPA